MLANINVAEFDDRALTYFVEDEKDMTLIGFIGFLDPAKPSAKTSIEALQKLGVTVKALIGDNEIVIKKNMPGCRYFLQQYFIG